MVMRMEEEGVDNARKRGCGLRFVRKLVMWRNPRRRRFEHGRWDGGECVEEVGDLQERRASIQTMRTLTGDAVSPQ